MMAVRNDLLNDGRTVAVKAICRVLEVPRSTANYQPRIRTPRPVDEVLAQRIYAIIQRFPAYGIRRVFAWITRREGLKVNRKKVARIMYKKGWTIKQRKKGYRPRVDGWKSIAPAPNIRWATDLASVFCGRDGWCTFVPVVDCCTREILGWELSTSARSKTAERALENALIARFGYTYGAPKGLLLRSDNGLVFGSKNYRALVNDYGLVQEYITPYTPEQNGLCERLIGSFKEECVWVQPGGMFKSIDEARREIRKWVDEYNTIRPHQALNNLSPLEYLLKLQEAV